MKKSKIIRDEILNIWKELIIYRNSKGHFDNENPRESSDKKSRITTAEGLECFLIPAVNSNEFKKLLDEILSDEKNKAFKDNFASDISFLINESIVKKNSKLTSEQREAKGFFGDPYLPMKNLSAIVRKNYNSKIEITDSVCFTVSAMIHVRKLFNETSFSKQKKISFNDIDHLIETGINKIIKWHIKGEGWGWTNCEDSVETDMYSTWTVAETFAEIDDHLLKKNETSNLSFNEKELWNCIEEAKNFFISSESGSESLLDSMTYNHPLHFGDQPNEKNKEYIMNLYNDLYALDAMILFYSDRKWIGHSPWNPSNGEEREVNTEVRNKFEVVVKKIFKLFSDHKLRYNIDDDISKNNTLTNSDVLKKEEYVFDLTGGFLDESKRDKSTFKDYFQYGDKSFIPMFLKILILMARYELGNPIVIDKLINELYIDLTLTRYSEDSNYKYLWDEDFISIYSTERSIEALTDLFLYFKEKESYVAEPSNSIAVKENNSLTYESLQKWLSLSAYILEKTSNSDIKNYSGNPKDIADLIISSMQSLDNISHSNPTTTQKKVKINIEFAHSKVFLKTLNFEDLEGELSKEIDKVKLVIQNYKHKGEDYCISIMIDDYNIETKVDAHEFKEYIEKIYDVQVDYIIMESELASFADDLIQKIESKKAKKMRKNKNGEDEWYIDYSGKDTILYTEKNKTKSYSCELLTACWYLSRLCECEDLFSNIEKKMFSFPLSKPFFAESIYNFLDNDKYGNAEKGTKELLKLIKGKDFVEQRIETHLY